MNGKIFIDSTYNFSYVSPNLVDMCGFNKEVHVEFLLVKLVTDEKKSVHGWVRSCALDLNGIPTSTHLNVFSLGSYTTLFGIYWLYLHRTKVVFYDKAIECLDDNGEQRVLHNKKKETLVRMVRNMQEKHSRRKGYVLFAMHISIHKGKDVEDAEALSRYPVL